MFETTQLMSILYHRPFPFGEISTCSIAPLDWSNPAIRLGKFPASEMFVIIRLKVVGQLVDEWTVYMYTVIT